jgi:hypothetical protein
VNEVYYISRVEGFNVVKQYGVMVLMFLPTCYSYVTTSKVGRSHITKYKSNNLTLLNAIIILNFVSLAYITQELMMNIWRLKVHVGLYHLW